MPARQSRWLGQKKSCRQTEQWSAHQIQNGSAYESLSTHDNVFELVGIEVNAKTNLYVALHLNEATTMALKCDYPTLTDRHMPPRQRLLLGQRLFKLGKITMDLSKELQVGSGQQTPIKIRSCWTSDFSTSIYCVAL